MKEYKFILVNGVPVPEPDTLKWAQWIESDENRGVANIMIGQVMISTVFLGISLSIYDDDDTPHNLFETMIFGGEHDRQLWRCDTLEQAMRQHENATALVQASIKSTTLWNNILNELQAKGFLSALNDDPPPVNDNDMDLLDLDS